MVEIALYDHVDTAYINELVGSCLRAIASEIQQLKAARKHCTKRRKPTANRQTPSAKRQNTCSKRQNTSVKRQNTSTKRPDASWRS